MPDEPLPAHAAATALHSTSPSPSGAAELESVAGPAARRRYISQQLFGGTTEVEILHGEAVYRLRLTSLGKLILTK